MMKPTFFKGVALGSVVSIVTLAAVSAYAGTGVGGVFNLGKSNTVNATTSLSGTTGGAQLNVVNKSSASNATGLNLNVQSGRPPLAVNSPTLVPNLNADLLDGRSSGQFQQRVTGACGNGIGIQSVNPQGTVNCAMAVVRPFVSYPTSYHAYFYAPTGLELFASCHDPQTELSISDVGSSGAVANWVYSVNGSTAVTAGGAVLQVHNGNAANFPFTSRIEGQWIFAESGYVVTVNAHGYDGGPNNCEFTGTVEIAPTS
jgi:hypothetical protein